MVNWLLGKTIRQIENDPVYKSYYCLKIVDGRGDIIISPVIDHAFLTRVVAPGLNLGIAAKTIKEYEYLAARLSEEEATEIMYKEIDFITEQLKD